MAAFFTQGFNGTGSAMKIADSEEFDRLVTVSTDSGNGSTGIGYTSGAVNFAIPKLTQSTSLVLPAGHELYASAQSGTSVWIITSPTV